MTADIHIFLSDFLHRRGLDDRDRFALRVANAMTAVKPWNQKNIKAAVGSVQSDLYRRNPTHAHETVIDLIATRVIQRWPSNPATSHKVSTPMLKILFIAAEPIQIVASDLATGAQLVRKPLALDREFREIQSKIRASAERDLIQLVPCLAATPDDLMQSLHEVQPQIVHFSGHGTDGNDLVFVGKNGKPSLIPMRAVESLFRVMKDDIRMVVLNACSSKPQAKAVTKHVEFAIGMTKGIGDEAAITFASSVYRAIGFGGSVKRAFEEGLLALQVHRIDEDRTPKLLSRKGVNPNDVRLIDGSEHAAP